MSSAIDLVVSHITFPFYWTNLSRWNEGAIDFGDSGRVACDVYHLYREDFKLLKSLGFHFRNIRRHGSLILSRDHSLSLLSFVVTSFPTGRWGVEWRGKSFLWWSYRCSDWVEHYAWCGDSSLSKRFVWKSALLTIHSSSRDVVSLGFAVGTWGASQWMVVTRDGRILFILCGQMLFLFWRSGISLLDGVSHPLMHLAGEGVDHSEWAVVQLCLGICQWRACSWTHIPPRSSLPWGFCSFFL